MQFIQKLTAYGLPLLIGTSLFLSLSSCKKVEEVTPTVNSVFSILDSELVEEAFPDPSGSNGNQPVISDISNNGSIVAGGTNLITINFEDPQEDAEFVLVSMDGEDGYYRSPISSNDGSASMTMLLDQDLIENALALLFSVMDEKGHVSEHYTVPVKRVEAGTGNLQVSLSWDVDNDIDLHLVQPDGEEIYYGNEGSSTGGRLDLDSNAGCFIDGVRNENITFDEEAVVLAGDYIVRVDFYEDCTFWGTGSKTNYSVVAYLEGQLVASTTGRNPVTGVFAPGTATNGGEGDGVEVMRFNVPRQIGKTDLIVIDYGFTARKRKAATNPKVQ